MNQGMQNQCFWSQGNTIRSTKFPGVVYQQKEQLGQGSEGTVYLGINLKEQKKVAIKVLRRMTDNEKCQTEKLSGKSFEHIIDIYELMILPNQIIVVMELADGELYNLYNNVQFRNLGRKIRHGYFLQIVEGVKELHSLDLFHRDLKPENVVYIKKENGEMILKLCDFGLVKQQNNQDLRMTKKIGTPYYMAPEMVDENNACYTNKVDIWALGMMWYELLCGQTMITGQSIEEIQNRIMSITDSDIEKKIKESKVFQEEWEEYIIKKILVKNPYERLTANNLFNLLKTCLEKGNLGLQQKPIPVIQPQSRILNFNNNQSRPNQYVNQIPQPQPGQQQPFKQNFQPMAGNQKSINFPPNQIQFQYNNKNPQPSAAFKQASFQPQLIQQKINQETKKEILEKQASQDFEVKKQQFEEQIKREKEIELQKKLQEAEEEAKRKYQFELQQKEQLLNQERKKREQELQQLGNEKQKYQQQMFDLQMKFNNDIDEFKKQQEKELEQANKEREERLRKQIEQQLQQEMILKEQQLKKEIEKQIIEKNNIEYNRQLKLKEQERIKELQQAFNENKGLVLNQINISLNMIENFLQSLQQKKAEQQNLSQSAENIQYVQQIDNYIQEMNEEIALVQTDLRLVQNLNYEQNENNETLMNYGSQYQKFSQNFVVLQFEKNQKLAQIYQNILSRKSMQEEEKARQLKQFQEQQFNQIQQLKGQFNSKLEELNKINYYFLQIIQEKESLSKFYEPFDKEQKLSTIIVKLKQESNYFSQLNLNFEMLIQEQQDNISQIQSLQFNLQQLQSYESKSKELYGELENFVLIQEAIEQDIKIKKRKLIEDCLDQLDYFQANGESLNLVEFQINQSLYVQQLIKSIQEKINSLEQIKRYLSEQLNQSNINPQTISLELQQINQKVQYCQQYIAQIQESKKQLESALAEARLLDQFNKQKIILIETTKQKINQHSQVIQNLINTISQLAQECQFQVEKQGINQKIQYLQQINQNAQNTFVQITMVSEFKSQQEFQQFKQALDKFVLKNQDIVKAEEISVKDLKKSFQQLMLKEQNESEQLFSQAQQLYETIASSLIEFQQEYDQFKQFPQISQIKEFKEEQQLLEVELNNLQQMLVDGKDDLQIIKDVIITKNKQTIGSLRNDSIGILNKFQKSLEINIKQLQEKLSELNQIQIPQNYLQNDLQPELDKFQRENQYIQQFQQQLNLNFTQLQNQRGQPNQQLKIQSNNFIQQFQKWQDYEKKNIDTAINQWKRFNEMLNKQLESFIITKMIVNLIKLFNAKRYAERLNQDLFKAKKMSQAQESKFKEKVKSDGEKYKGIMNFEQQIVSKYQLWFRPNQLMNLNLENTINNIQEERQKADGYLGELLNSIKSKNLVKLRKSLKKEEDIKMIVALLPKLELVDGKIYTHLVRQ